MGFVAVDPSTIKFDAPQAASAPTGFVPVDPSKIQFDAPASGPGVLSRIGTDIANRLAEGAQSERDYQAGKIGLPTAMIQQFGKIAGGLSGDALSGITNAIVPQSVKDAANTSAQFLADKLDNIQAGQAIGNISMRTGEGYDKLDPQTKKTVESVADIANIIPAINTLKGGASLVGKVTRIPDIGTNLPGILGNTSSGVTPMTAANISTLGGASLIRKVGGSAGDVVGALRSDADILNTGQLQDIAKRGFATADSSGGYLAPNATNSLMDRVTSNTPQTAEGKAFAGDDVVTKTAQDFDSLRDKPLTLAGSMEVDKNLGDRIVAAKRAGNNEAATQLTSMQRDFRNGLMGAGDTGDLVGGADGVQGWREGQQAWAAAMKMRDLDAIEKAGAASDNPAKTIATGAKNLLKSPLKSWGWRPEELAALQATSRTGILTDALRTAGSRLGPIMAGTAGFATGGLPGMAAASVIDFAGSTAARNSATALQSARLNAVRRLVSDRPEIAKMTAPGSATASPAITPPNPATLYPNLATHPLYSNLGLKAAMQLPPTQARVALRMSKP